MSKTSELIPSHFSEVTQITEANVTSATPDGRIAREVVVTVIKPGMNKSGSRYYSTKLLESHAKMFAGSKMYADHLTPQQERALGGMPRSVRDLVGVLKETWWDAPTQTVKGKVRIVRDWFGEIVAHDATAVGVSIDTIGTSRHGVIGGRNTRVVESFTKVRSVDFVTMPGAGGQIDSILESHTEVELMLENITLDDIKKHRPDLIEEATAATTGGHRESDGGGAENDKDALTADSVREMITEAVTKATKDIKTDADKRVALADQRGIVKEALRESNLAEASQTDIYGRFHDRVFEATEDKTAEVVCKEAVAQAIKDKKDEIRQYAGSARVVGMGVSATMLESEGGAPAEPQVHNTMMQAIHGPGWKPEAAKAGE